MEKLELTPIGAIHSEHQVAKQTPIQPVCAEGSPGRVPFTSGANGGRDVPSKCKHLGCKKRASGGLSGGSSGRNPCKSLVGAPGFEPGTSSLSGRINSLPRWTQGNPASHRQSQELWRVAAKIRSRLPKESQRSLSQTAHLGCKMIASGPMGASVSADPLG